MNKLLSKIAGLSVGLALAIGVGVAVDSKEARVAKASEALAASCNMAAKTANCSGYSKEHTYGDYKIYGGQNNNGGWEFFKFGGKKSKAEDPDKVTEGYIKGTVALTQEITKVEVVVVANTASSDVTWDLEVASDAGFETIVDTTATTTLDRSKSGTATAIPTSGTSWAANCYYRVNLHITNHSTTNGCLTLTAVNFYYESTTPRGEIAIDDVERVITVGDSDSLSYTWTPASGSSATISSHTWVSSDSTILSISGDTYTAAAPGVVTLTLNATDSNSEEYSVSTSKIFVTNAYSFAVGDNVALYASGASMELSSINKEGSNHYGVGTEYADSPVGLYALTVEAGTEAGSFAFKNGDDYLYWSSGNSLSSNTTKNINASWFVIAHDDYMIISNAADSTREVWWNSGNPRFACYQGKTTETSGYNSVSLVVIEDVPVRGTVAITAPTETLLRQGASGTATYSWTAPEEAPSTTIASHTWTSSDTAVFSVSGDTYTAVGEGKAKLILNATDSNGEEYTASTKDITVVGVVSGTYEKKYNVVEGDTVAIVCEADETEFSGMSSAGAYSTYVFYNDAPASIYDFVLEEGSVDGSFALKNSDSKYLAWTKSGAADIGLVDEIQENSSWTIEFEDGNAKITNCALDGEVHRYLAWNHGSPRFAAYKTGQTAIQLYAPAIALEASAVAFANSIIDDLTCDSTGKSAPSSSVWEDLEEAYADVTAKGKEQLHDIYAVHHENPVTDKQKVEEALAKYDYIVGKYFVTGLDTSFTDFIGREPAPVTGGAIARFDLANTDNNTMIIVIAVAAVSALAFTTLLVFKKKKQK